MSTVSVLVCLMLSLAWSLEVYPAKLHRIGGMVGRHCFAAGEAAFPTLRLCSFPGTTEEHKVYLHNLYLFAPISQMSYNDTNAEGENCSSSRVCLKLVTIARKPHSQVSLMASLTDAFYCM